MRYSRKETSEYIVMCVSVARQRVAKHFLPATNTQATIEDEAKLAVNLYLLLSLLFNLEGRGSALLRNDSERLPDYTASQPRPSQELG
jgi:hypothetical protein